MMSSTCNCGKSATSKMKFNSSEMPICEECIKELAEWFEQSSEEGE